MAAVFDTLLSGRFYAGMLMGIAIGAWLMKREVDRRELEEIKRQLEQDRR